MSQVETLPSLPKASRQVQAFNIGEEDLLVQIERELYSYNYTSKKYNSLGNITTNEKINEFNSINITPYFNDTTDETMILCFGSSGTSDKVIIITELTINNETKNIKKQQKFTDKNYCYLNGSRALLIGKDKSIIILLSTGKSWNSGGMISIFNLKDETAVDKNVSKDLNIDKICQNCLISVGSTSNDEFIIFGGPKMDPYSMYVYKYSSFDNDITLVKQLSSNNLNGLCNFDKWYYFSYLQINKQFVLCVGGRIGSGYLDVILLYDLVQNRWFKTELTLPKKIYSKTNNNLCMEIDNDDIIIHYLGGWDGNKQDVHYEFILPFSNVKINENLSGENETKENLDYENLRKENEQYKVKIKQMSDKLKLLENNVNTIKNDYELKLLKLKQEYNNEIKSLKDNKMKSELENDKTSLNGQIETQNENEQTEENEESKENVFYNKNNNIKSSVSILELLKLFKLDNKKNKNNELYIDTLINDGFTDIIDLKELTKDDLMSDYSWYRGDSIKFIRLVNEYLRKHNKNYNNGNTINYYYGSVTNHNYYQSTDKNNINKNSNKSQD